MATDLTNDSAVTNLRNYLRIRSVHPNVNYDECLTYLRGQASQLELAVQVVEPLPKKPVLVITWQGSDPKLPTILLNSHMDVVPVFEKSWKYPPFDAVLEDGVIYGRGVQDMKSMSIQYIEAVRRLKAKGVRLKRTVHLSFVPDEEIGGGTGMKEFVKTEAFRKLNVGFALDEGMSSPTDDYLLFYGERSIWHITITCPGLSGHGSLLLPDNSGEKIRHIIDKFMDLRKESKEKLEKNPELTIGDVTCVNLTMLHGGVQANVVPEKLTATFDIRLALSQPQDKLEDMIKSWCAEAGQGVTYEFSQKDVHAPTTNLDDTNDYWKAFKAVTDQLGLSVKPRIFPGGTDSRYIRLLGVPALGFSPMARVLPTIHQHNESLPVSVFLKGIDIYESIIPALANV